ncbi:MAG: hypothetical protein ACLQFR_25530 [Streptosporangiaceae bacterium]
MPVAQLGLQSFSRDAPFPVAEEVVQLASSADPGAAGRTQDLCGQGERNVNE